MIKLSSQSKNFLSVLWWICGFVLIGLVIIDAGHITWRDPFFARQYPLLLLFVIIVELVTSVVMFRGSRKYLILLVQQIPAKTWAGLAILIIDSALLYFVWVTTPAVPNHPIIGLARLYLTPSLLIGGYWLLYQGDLGTYPPPSIPRWLIPTFLIAVALVLTLIYLGVAPHILDYDEPFELNLSVTLTRTQSLHWPMYPGMSPLVVSFVYSALNWPAGVWLNTIGIGVPQLRLLFLLIAWSSLIFIFYTSRNLYGNLAAVIAVGVAGLIPMAEVYARPDSFVVLTTSIALCLYVMTKHRPSLLWPVLIGFVLGLGIEGHRYAVRFIIAFGLLYMGDYLSLLWKERRIQWKHPLGAFCLGCTLFGVFYIIFHIVLVSPTNGLSDVFKALSDIYSYEVGISGYSSYFERLTQTNLKFYTNYIQMHLPETMLILTVIGLALRRHSAADILVLKIWFISLIVGAFMLTHGSMYYGLFNMPFLALLVGAFISSLGRNILQETTHGFLMGWNQLLVISVVVIMLISNVVTTSYTEDTTAQFIQIAKRLDTMLPPNYVIGSSQVFYLGMPSRLSYLVDLFGLTNFFPAFAAKNIVPQALIVPLENGTIDDGGWIAASGLQKMLCFPPFGIHQVIVYLPVNSITPPPDLVCPSE